MNIDKETQKERRGSVGLSSHANLWICDFWGQLQHLLPHRKQRIQTCTASFIPLFRLTAVLLLLVTVVTAVVSVLVWVVRKGNLWGFTWLMMPLFLVVCAVNDQAWVGLRSALQLLLLLDWASGHCWSWQCMCLCVGGTMRLVRDITVTLPKLLS